MTLYYKGEACGVKFRLIGYKNTKLRHLFAYIDAPYVASAFGSWSNVTMPIKVRFEDKDLFGYVRFTRLLGNTSDPSAICAKQLIRDNMSIKIEHFPAIKKDADLGNWYAEEIRVESNSILVKIPKHWLIEQAPRFAKITHGEIKKPSEVDTGIVPQDNGTDNQPRNNVRKVNLRAQVLKTASNLIAIPDRGST